MTLFIGREYEMARLRELLNKKSAILIIVKGRRRIGKSRLLREFGKELERTYIFSGLPPNENTTAHSQREEFRRQLGRELEIRGISADDWGDLFWHLAQKTQEGQVLVVLDEITWMGCLDSEFLGKLKNAWDLYFSQNPQLILALSGSMSAWIKENILSSTGFLGRDSLTLTLRELPLNGDRCQVSALDTEKIISFNCLDLTPRLTGSLKCSTKFLKIYFHSKLVIMLNFEGAATYHHYFTQQNAFSDLTLILLNFGSPHSHVRDYE